MIKVYESLSDEVRIIRKGSKERGMFFAIFGSIFQVLFLWGYWSFLDETGPLAIFWLTIINSEFFPFTFILFVFGAGCFLVALRDLGWEEKVLVRNKLTDDLPGIIREIRLFHWSRSSIILKNQIVTLRLHSIRLDQFNINHSSQIELDYKKEPNSSLKSIIIYKDSEDKIHSRAEHLVEKIYRILSLSGEIEKTESATINLEKKKRGEKNNSKKS